ncbi:trypsin-like serine peptidase [Candidatus Venteria ishoeyi]|uniref:Trypsin n=1 Tax=Candidatus Venteria ishoeyi TaxID=1899563 RepID=A0A1H6F624_9GAMM|nr:hypothetical protein [Candidatus Venteria ishoeyi]SEH04435.1 Uncharacterised protein [Candidatus Venteria ishoeyi]
MLDHCIARVWKKGGGIAGTAFLVTEKHLLTCAHVVNFVFGKEKNYTDKPTDSFEVDFPYFGKSKIRVKVRNDLWYPLPLEPSSQSDIAVLEVQNELPLGGCPRTRFFKKLDF